MESLAPAYSLSNCNLAWKTASLLALVTAKHCCDLTLLHVDNQPLFPSVMLLFLFLYLLVRRISFIIFHLKFILNLIPLLIFALCFTLGLIYAT